MYTELTNTQAKQYLDAVSAYEGWVQSSHQALDYSGGMHWKTIAGKQYLYKTLDRRGNAKSCGPRSEVTERIYTDFTRRKKEITERRDHFKTLMGTHARVNAALRVGSVPNEVADVCIALDNAHLMGKSIMVIGTNAMHAYAFLAGVRFPSDIMATTDVDLLWNHKAKLSLAANNEIHNGGLLGLLQKVDRTYAQDTKNSFRARAGSGFMVDLIRQMPQPPWANEPDRFFEKDLIATDIKNMNWLLSAPRIEQPVIAINGQVFSMTVPDPRAFALFKFWLSQSPDRDPVKAPRDLAQAQAITKLIEDRLPHLGNWGALQSFPKKLLESVATKTNEANTSVLETSKPIHERMR